MKKNRQKLSFNTHNLITLWVIFLRGLNIKSFTFPIKIRNEKKKLYLYIILILNLKYCKIEIKLPCVTLCNHVMVVTP